MPRGKYLEETWEAASSKGQVVLARRKAGSLQEGQKCGVVSG